MTIETTVSCDGHGCFTSMDVDPVYDVEQKLERKGWYTDPNDEEHHYCPKCRDAAKKEIEGE